MKGKSQFSAKSNESTSKLNNDMKNSTTISRWLLMIVGIWPIDSHVSIVKRIMLEIRVLITYSLIFFLLIPCALHTFFDEKDLRRKVKLFGPVIFYSMGVVKFSILVARRKNISKCLDHMLVDWQQGSSTEDREIMLANVKISSLIASICTIFSCISALFIRLIIPLSMGKRLTTENITVRPLGSPVYKPLFTAIESPSYEIVFITQTISALLLYGITVGACSLAAVFVLHACGQLQIIMNKIDSFVEKSECVDDMFKNRIAVIVKHHYRILSFINNIELTMNEVCLVEFLGCMIEICLIGYYLLTEMRRAETLGIITYCFLLISFTFNIFVFCYIGEMLTQQGNKLNLTTSMIEWYKLPRKSAKDLILLLVMTNCPYHITAGKVAELSYKSFSNLLKTSMGYFNLLRKVI